MGKVFVHVTMSLDGFVAGADPSPEQPMGAGGMRLHDWVFKASASDVDTEVIQELFGTTGAVILGRRTFDVGLGAWEDTPFPVPCFVLTHRGRDQLPMRSGTFTFVTDGIHSALRRAQAAARGRHINLMGADVTQQYLRAGLVDEVQLQLSPVLLGSGKRLFEHLGTGLELERTGVAESPYVTHLRYRVVK
ncbi:MAG TPA: dihydrofolate reductase family protein [Rugosimonospora sp.]|nr:dihydrofolate reductase family protein [Rugosimonospora sp.]